MPLSLEVGLGPGHIVLDWDTALSPKRGRGTAPNLAHIYCGQTAGWVKMPLGMEVDLSPGHIVLDGDPARCETAQQLPPVFGPCLLWPRSPISATAELFLDLTLNQSINQSIFVY